MEARRVGRLKLAYAETARPLLPVERQARLLGLLEAEAALATSHEGGRAASMETLHRLLGTRGLVEAVKAGCVEYVPGTLLGVVHEHRCAAL